MTLHTEELKKPAEKKQTLGEYLIEKIGGKLKGEDGNIFGEGLEIEVIDAQTTEDDVKRYIKGFYGDVGFDQIQDHGFGFTFENKEKGLIRIVTFSYFEDTGMCRVSAGKIGPK